MINKITPDALAKHLAWLQGKEGGVRLEVECYASLRNADLHGACLRDASLHGAYLRGAYLCGASLRDADLHGADLHGADLRGADLHGADLRGADLRDADLRGAKNIPDYVSAVTSIVADGNLIVYKKLRGNRIAMLRIPAEAKRSNSTGRKCRAEYAEVVKIESIDGEKSFEEGISQNDKDFVYRVGEVVRPDAFCEDRWQECASGIHFFITRYEAEAY